MYFLINHQQMILNKQPFVVGNSNDYLTAEFSFSEDWDGLAKVAFFGNGTNTYAFLLVDDKVTADKHLNLTGGEWNAWVYGFEGEVTDVTELPTDVMRISTNMVCFDVKMNGGTNGEVIPLTPPGIGEQILAVATEAAEIAQSVRDDADAGVFKGDKGDTGETGAQGPAGADGADGKSAYASAQDGGYTGTETQFNSDLTAVGDKYELPEGGIPDTDLSQSVQDSLSNADTALQEVPIASNETLGGIKAGSDFDIAEDGTLSLYKALTMSASVSPSSAEMGSTIDEVTVSWTLNKTPVSQSVDGVDVPVSVLNKILTDLGITDSRTFNVTAADARMSLTRNPGITFYRYVYSQIGSPDAAPTQASECVKQADLSTFGSNGADFNYTAGNTLWLLTTKANAQIQTNVLGQWADVTTIYAGTVEFTQANGAVATYYAYNTGVFGGTGSAKYRIR